jgi:2-keto-3-deoxy-L-rhamnonate aldolase RhmA
MLLPENGAAVGIFVKSPDPDGARIAAAAGLDVAIVDLEHSTLDLADAAALVGVLADCGVVPIVRIPVPDPVTVAKMIECGAGGIQLASTTTVAQVRAMIDAVEYPPRGRRGVSFAHRAARWGLADPATAPAPARPVAIIIQIEAATTIDPLADIVAAGADLVFVGVEDLRMTCRAEGVDFDARFDEIVSAATEAGVSWGCPAAPEKVAQLRTRGGRLFTIGADRAIYARALSVGVTAAGAGAERLSHPRVSAR